LNQFSKYKLSQGTSYTHWFRRRSYQVSRSFVKGVRVSVHRWIRWIYVSFLTSSEWHCTGTNHRFL